MWIMKLVCLQAASEVSIKLKGLTVDIDAADVDDELAVVEYLDDLYKFYKLTEVCFLLLLFI